MEADKKRNGLNQKDSRDMFPYTILDSGVSSYCLSNTTRTSPKFNESKRQRVGIPNNAENKTKATKTEKMAMGRSPIRASSDEKKPKSGGLAIPAFYGTKHQERNRLHNRFNDLYSPPMRPTSRVVNTYSKRQPQIPEIPKRLWSSFSSGSHSDSASKGNAASETGRNNGSCNKETPEPEKEFIKRKIRKVKPTPTQYSIFNTEPLNRQKLSGGNPSKKKTLATEIITVSSDEELDPIDSGAAANDQTEDKTQRAVSAITEEMETDQPLWNSTKYSPWEGRSVIFPVRMLQFGTLRFLGVNVFSLTQSNAITLRFKVNDKNCNLIIRPTEIEKIEWGDTSYATFLDVVITSGSAHRVRNLLKMKKGTGPWFDPHSSREEEKKILIVAEKKLSLESTTEMVAILKTFSIEFLQIGPLVIEEYLKIAKDTAKMFLDEDSDMMSTPKTATAASEMATSKKTTPKMVMPKMGTPKLVVIHKLVTSKTATPQTVVTPKMVTPKTATVTPKVAAATRMAASKPYALRNASTDDIEVKKLCIYPPPPAKGGIPITSQDMACLKPGELLNDIIIDFYLRYIFMEQLTPPIKEATHIFSQFFYHRLTARPPPGNSPLVGGQKSTLQQRQHSQVKSWTKNIDIFAKSYLVVPINKDDHWFVAIIVHPYLASDDFNMEEKNCFFSSILIFDSMRVRRTTVFNHLKGYLEQEWLAKGKAGQFIKKNVKEISVKAPVQLNHTDCGLFLLSYVQKYFEDLPEMKSPFPNMEDWFSHKEVSQKRKEIQSVILKLSQSVDYQL